MFSFLENKYKLSSYEVARLNSGVIGIAIVIVNESFGRQSLIRPMDNGQMREEYSVNRMRIDFVNNTVLGMTDCGYDSKFNTIERMRETEN